MKFGIGVLIGTFIVGLILIMSACSSPAKVHKPHCPVCDEHNPTEEHLNSHAVENYEVTAILEEWRTIEEPVLTRDYEEPQTGSFDFPMYGEPVGLEGYCACVCCGVYIIDDPNIISEHLKTCCP